MRGQSKGSHSNKLSCFRTYSELNEVRPYLIVIVLIGKTFFVVIVTPFIAVENVEMMYFDNDSAAN